MAEIAKPDLSLIWASSGDTLKPSDTKIQQGWQVEIPPRQWFNWYQNKTDTAIAHINQHGIPVWDAKTEYQANKSYVQDETGVVYKALQTNVNREPSDNPDYWMSAFADATASPAGMVVPFARTTAPAGWLKCNGVAVSRTTYARLFAAIGTTFGSGDGSTTFNLPELRGEFVRGLDDGRGIDPNRTLGSFQKGTLVAYDDVGTQPTADTLRGTPASIGGDSYSASQYTGTTLSYTQTSIVSTNDPAGAVATRPRNIAMLYCIKF